MFKELFMNAAILICGLYIGSHLFRQPIMPQSSPWSRMYYGSFLGLVGTALIYFHSDTGALIFDFSVVCVLLASFYGGWISSLTSAVVIGSSMMTLLPSAATGTAEPIALLLTAVCSSLLSRLKIRLFARWMLSVLAAIVLQASALLLRIDQFGNIFPSYLFYCLSLFLAALAADKYIRNDVNRRTLVTENTYLTQHDLLTGLLNFQTFHSGLQVLLAENRRVLFMLIDCDDVKSLNTEQGFHTVDGTLKKVAHLLKVCYPEALLMGRNGSDEFGIVVPYEDGKLEKYLHDLEHQIPKQADIQLSYGYAVYPDDESDRIAFAALVQKRLFESKRKLWLQREAHWLHSERLKAVGELAAGMAHEIRNPLTTVKGFLQISRQNNYNIGSYYDIIMHEIKRMSELTAEFLQFSKPVDHSPKKILLQDCVQAAIQLTESEVTRHGHQLVIAADEEPIHAFLDKDKIIQVMLNVIRNGIEAMEESGTLTITVTKRGEYGLIEVTDTGKGISENHLELLFQPFFSTKTKGTGLGLSICQRIVGEHGGYITVRSKVDVGTSFMIRLPLATGDELIA
ncbi:ATP-binding protein [Paenibacillus thermotolerans]|uniref:ATP-binding protein n=1 Tax=Paenibacillus thermotolerans TaxID=3027807 RepID=UPI002368464C|nr:MULTISPECIES: ATP-binding protein [unclassified Paenibacillus]